MLKGRKTEIKPKQSHLPILCYPIIPYQPHFSTHSYLPYHTPPIPTLFLPMRYHTRQISSIPPYILPTPPKLLPCRCLSNHSFTSLPFLILSQAYIGSRLDYSQSRSFISPCRQCSRRLQGNSKYTPMKWGGGGDVLIAVSFFWR